MQQSSSLWGWFFIGSGSLFFIGFLYATVLSKLLPPSDNPIISAVQNDRCLIPKWSWKDYDPVAQRPEAEKK